METNLKLTGGEVVPARAIEQDFYHIQTLSTAAEYTWFNVEEQTDGLAVTNWQDDGQLPAGQVFAIQGITLTPVLVGQSLDTDLDDFYAGFLRLDVGGVRQAELCLDHIGGGVQQMEAWTGGGDLGTDDRLMVPFRPRILKEPVIVGANQSLLIKTHFPTEMATGFVARMVLSGYLTKQI